MRTRDIKTAEQFGILERCKSFEKDLLKIKDIVPDKFDDGIPFDLTGFLSGIHQVIIVPQYDIRADRDNYWDARKQLKERVITLAEKYDLHRTEDRIEDQGTPPFWFATLITFGFATLRLPPFHRFSRLQRNRRLCMGIGKVTFSCSEKVTYVNK